MNRDRRTKLNWTETDGGGDLTSETFQKLSKAKNVCERDNYWNEYSDKKTK